MQRARLRTPVAANVAQRLHRTPDGHSRSLADPGYSGNQTLLRRLSRSGPVVRREPPAADASKKPAAPASPAPGPAPSPSPDAGKTDEVKLTIPWDEILKGNTTLMQVLMPPAPGAGAGAPAPAPGGGASPAPKGPTAGGASPPPSAPAPAPAAPSPDAPSRLSLKDFGNLSLGLRLGFPDLKSDTAPDAPPSALQQSIQTGEIINWSMTGKLPTAYQLDKGKLVGACWGLFSKYIAPDFAAKIAKGMSGKSAGGGLSYELDGVLLPDFSGAGVSFTLKFGGSSKKPAPAAPAPGPVQPKLKVGSTSDPLEAEADRAADQVMRMPASASEGLIQRKCAACEEEDKVHTKSNGQAEAEGNAPPIVSQALSSSGHALDTRTRAFFEKRFDADFSQVRVHTDSLAAQSADAVHARAYATGNHIVLGAGETSGPSRLLAHELAHVVQQQGPGPGAPTVRRGPHDLPEPNKAPGCEDVCGEGEKCVQGPGEKCSDDQNKAVCGSKPGTCSGGSMKKAVDNLTKAIDVMYNKPDSPAVAKSLADNFGWKTGGTPADLPTTVRTNLEAALARMGAHQLCIKCVTCGGKTVSAVYQARGQNCTDQNCFALCESFFKDAAIQPHALIHEFHHLVLPAAPTDMYRGASGYPDVPPIMLKMPDAYASLVDDLQKVTLPPAPKP